MHILFDLIMSRSACLSKKSEWLHVKFTFEWLHVKCTFEWLHIKFTFEWLHVKFTL